MRSPNAFVVALRKPDGTIRLRRDQWFGFSKKFNLLRKPFFRGIVTLFEAMANGIVALNYSANIALEEEVKKDALKKGKDLADLDLKGIKSKNGQSEKIDWATFFTIAVSLLFGVGLFVLTPHAATAGLSRLFALNWDLNGISFHLVDGTIKALIFILYIGLLGLIPDIRRVFQYHGAEHKAIATFEASRELNVKEAKAFPTLHPRCGTSFIFFLIFISIIIFSGLFALIPFGQDLPPVLKHISAIGIKIACMFPVAGISYEVIKLASKRPEHPVSRIFSYPGMALQKLTTREPEEDQLEVALVSIKAALALEDKFNLKEASSKVVGLEEVEVESLDKIEASNSTLKDFLEN